MADKIWKSFDELASEAERLKTYLGWPSVFVTPVDLASAGFFYLRDKDKVQCFFCRIIIGEWEAGDVPMAEHHRHSPLCSFIKRFNVGNIPKGMDETGREMNANEPEKLSYLGVTEHRAPQHTKYVTTETRLKTYHNWPQSIPQKPQVMAEAGFYYTDVADYVRCFSCDGGLRNWEVNDDPWVEHARWFGKCCFLRLVKGQDFISRHKTKPTADLEMSESVKSAIEVGIDLNTIRQVLAVTNYTNANNLIEACFDYPLENFGRLSCRTEPTTELTTELTTEPTTSISASPIKTVEQDEDKNERRLCTICMTEEIAVSFVPCGHFISCTKCASCVSDCPLCRKTIKGTFRTYLA